MEQIDEIIGKEFSQNCGDSLLVLEKLTKEIKEEVEIFYISVNLLNILLFV